MGMGQKTHHIDKAKALDEYQVLLAQDGDREAFTLLYTRWHPRLLRFAYRQTGNADAAQDVMQEAALTIAKNIARLKDPSLFSPWAYTIVRRRAADYIGKAARNRKAAQALADIPPSYEAVSTDDKLTLKHALAVLPDRDRQILKLFYLDGMSGPEIAAGMGLPIGTVKSRLYAARSKLKSIYQTNPKGDHNE